jgi:hypothetical protein
LKYSEPVVQIFKAIFILDPAKLKIDVSSASLIELLTLSTPSLAKPPTKEDPFND